jgi:hypothetical protein
VATGTRKAFLLDHADFHMPNGQTKKTAAIPSVTTPSGKTSGIASERPAIVLSPTKSY